MRISASSIPYGHVFASARDAANVRVGAHPGYPDRASMGRTPVDESNQIVYLKSIFDQLQWFTSAIGAAYIKPHGAFYNDTAVVLPTGWETTMRKSWTASPYETAGVFLASLPGVQSLGMLLRVHRLPLMGLPGTAHEVTADRSKQPFIREGFADRRYTEAGTLVPRSEPGAILPESEIREQVLRLAPEVDSICLHGDTPNCVEFAELIRATLEEAGYEVRA